MMTFVPNQDFLSSEFKSAYVKGMTYTIREGNTKLLAAVIQWVELGMVGMVEASTTDSGGTEAFKSKMSGQGEVVTITKDDIGELKL